MRFQLGGATLAFLVMAACGMGLESDNQTPTPVASAPTLDGRWDQRFDGGHSAVDVGDVDGDDVTDVLIVDVDRAWIVFGSSNKRVVDLSDNLGDTALKIRAPEGHYLFGAEAGDVDGDGTSDVILGDPRAHFDGRGKPGMAYVITRSTSGTLDLTDLAPSDGFRVIGSDDFVFAGQYVAGGHDVNGDGFSDVIVAAPFAPATYVVFGSASPQDVDLRDFEMNGQLTEGFLIRTPVPGGNSIYALASPGDMDSDGLSDIAIGLVPDSRSWGAVYVVFGKEDPLPIDVRSQGTWGYRVRSSRATGFIGDSDSVFPAGDFNGDGVDDLAFGGGGPRPKPVSVYVLFGGSQTDDVMLDHLGSRGLRIKGLRPITYFGSSVSSLRANKDRFGDLIIGAHQTSFSFYRAGSVYIVRGRSGSGTIDVKESDEPGVWRLDGHRRGLYFGADVSGIADLDGDGRSEFAGGTLGEDHPNKVFVVFSAN